MKRYNVTEEELKELRISTSDAYSFHRYKRTAWNVAIRSLANFGYNKEQIECILRSKLMRWAADQFANVGPRGGESLSGREVGMYLEKYPTAAKDLFEEAGI